MRKSVAIIGSRGYPSYYGGFETLVRRLAPFLAERDWDVTVYGRRSTQGQPHREVSLRERRTLGVDSRSLSTLSYGCTATLDAVTRLNPDACLVLNVANGYFLPLLRRRGIPTAVNVDGLEWERDKWGKLAKGVFRRGADMTARYADTLIYDAAAIGDYWTARYGRPGVVIPYGGDARESLPFKEQFREHAYALMVARLVPENTVAPFLAAAERLAQDHEVVIVGSSGYSGELEQRVSRLSNTNKNVHWLGHMSDDQRLHSLWQNAGVYFHGHTVGGTNPALVQAMALGAPTVAVDTVFNREVLGPGGVFTSVHQDDIYQSLVHVLTDETKRTALRSDALSRAAAHYDWNAVCCNYEDALNQLVRTS